MGHLICVNKFEFYDNNFVPGRTYRYDEKDNIVILSKKFYFLHRLIKQRFDDGVRFKVEEESVMVEKEHIDGNFITISVASRLLKEVDLEFVKSLEIEEDE